MRRVDACRGRQLRAVPGPGHLPDRQVRYPQWLLPRAEQGFHNSRAEPAFWVMAVRDDEPPASGAGGPGPRARIHLGADHPGPTSSRARAWNTHGLSFWATYPI